MKRHKEVVLLIVLFLFSFCAIARAELYRVVLDARSHAWWAQNTTLRQGMHFWVEVYDTKFSNPPDFVSSIEVKAPDGTVFPITTRDHWTAIDQGYAATYEAPNFASGTLPAGTYTVTVKAGGKTISAVDVVKPVVFLDGIEVSYPEEGASGIPENAVITWKSVGAHRYGIQLWDMTGGTFCGVPVLALYAGMRQYWTNKNQFPLPKGTLKPNRAYRLQIQARSDLQDTDSRSFSKWVAFTTGNW